MQKLSKIMYFFCFASFLLLLVSCGKEQENLTAELVDEEVIQEDLGHVHEVSDHIKALDFNLDEVEKVDFELPDGTFEERFLIEDDVTVSREELDEIKAYMENGVRQYRTYNTVSPYQTIYVLGYTGGSYALSTKMRTALRWAVDNYNALNLNLSFSLSYGTNTTPYDIVVYQVSGGAGGRAGFPSGGNPYKWVQIYSGLNSATYSTNVVEHVIGHEIGHCLGLRHTDYASRASCGQNSNEGSAGVGAVHIPGTPVGIDWNSLMLACFGTDEDGEFGYYDRIALQYLY